MQSRAVILKGRSIFLPLLASVAVMIALTVFACVRSDPNKTSFVPKIEANENEVMLFNENETALPQAGVCVTKLEMSISIFGAPMM